MTTSTLPLPSVLDIPAKPRKGVNRELSEMASLHPLGSANRVTAVVDQLTQVVLKGEFKPGSLLPPERDLAEHLGVSRNAVREATKIMQSRGLLSVKQGLGTVVTGVTSAPMQQMFTHALHGNEEALLHLTEVRLSLEVQIAAWAAERATESNVARLEELLGAMGANLSDNALYADLDVEFHMELARATQNPLFVLMLESVATMLHESRELALSTAPMSVTQVAQQAHERIFQAVAAHDGLRAADAMSAHLELQRRDFEQRLAASGPPTAG